MRSYRSGLASLTVIVQVWDVSFFRRFSIIGAALLVAGVGVLAIARQVGAQPIAVVEGEPVSIDAQHLVVDLNKGTAALSGAVTVRRGDLSVSCDSLEARYDSAPNIKWAKASGSVVATLKGLRAQAPEAELLLPEKTLRLRGGVKIMRGGAWIEAKEAQIEMATGKVSLEQVKGSIPVTEIPGVGPR